MVKFEWTTGNMVYVAGLGLTAAIALLGSAIFGPAALYIPAIIAIAAFAVAFIKVAGVDKNEVQTFLLWSIAMGVVGVAAMLAPWASLGLQLLANVIQGVGQYFIVIAISMVILLGNAKITAIKK